LIYEIQFNYDDKDYDLIDLCNFINYDGIVIERSQLVFGRQILLMLRKIHSKTKQLMKKKSTDCNNFFVCEGYM